MEERSRLKEIYNDLMSKLTIMSHLELSDKKALIDALRDAYDAGMIAVYDQMGDFDY